MDRKYQYFVAHKTASVINKTTQSSTNYMQFELGTSYKFYTYYSYIRPDEIRDKANLAV